MWVVGQRSYADARAVLYHFNGQSWRQVTSVADNFTFAPLTDVWGTAATNDAIWGSSASDAWIVGQRTVLRHDGQGWAPVALRRIAVDARALDPWPATSRSASRQ